MAVSPTARVLGRNLTTEVECRALCEAHSNCTIYTGPQSGVKCTLQPSSWCGLCMGRTDRKWQLHPVQSAISVRRVVPR